MSDGLTRRSLIANGAALATLAAGVNAAQGLTLPAIAFGSAINMGVMQSDIRYRDLYARYCQILVAESEMKWESLRPAPGKFDFGPADQMMAFAEKNAMKVRGHNLVWYEANPEWVNQISSSSQAEHELVYHIETVVRRYKGRIISWDVVNEPIADQPEGKMIAHNVWAKWLGFDYMTLAFNTAAKIDPAAQLTLNDYGYEIEGAVADVKRATTLQILEKLKAKGVPVGALALESHLNTNNNVDIPAFKAFITNAADMGLDILVSELDVVDQNFPADLNKRDQMIADAAKRYLEAIGEIIRPSAVLTWGMTDRYTWLSQYFARKDGQPIRPLPFDRDYRPKLLWQVIEGFCRGS